MKAAFAARVNLVTQVKEVVNFSCWSRKSTIYWDRSPRKNCQPAELRKVLVSI